jgi:hypothetical protein
MTDIAPRSWRSILFRPGRPPMRKRTAVLLCVATLLIILVFDVLILTNARVLGHIASMQIRKLAGEVVAYESLTMTVGVQLRMERFQLRLPGPSRPVLSARRVRVSIGHRDGGVVAESVTLEEPVIRFSDRIARELAGDPSAPKRPVNEMVSSRDLPRITCRGGRLELAHSEFLATDEPQVFEIIDLAMVPTTGYRYFVRGAVRNAVVGQWSIQGEVDLEGGGHRVHLVNERLVLGPAIRDALRPTIHDAWDKYRPAGPAVAEIYLDQEAGFRLALKPRGISLVYREFAYPCEEIHGEIEFRTNGFTVKHIDARSGKSTKIRFDGSADGYESDAGYHFRLEMDDVAFDDTLKNALKKDAQDVWGQFKPSGRLDARATIHRERGGPEVKESMPVDLHLKGASLQYSGFPYTIEKTTGEIRIDGDNVAVKRLQGSHGGAQLVFSGLIQSIAQDPVIDLDVRATRLALDGRLRDALSPEARKVFDMVGATGEIFLHARVLRSPGGEPQVRALVRALGNRVQFRDAPLPLLIQDGTVEINEGRIRLNHLKGKLDPGEGELEVSGEITPGPEGSTTHLEIDGTGIPIDDRFRDRVPKALGEVLRSVQVSGIADFKFTLDERPERDRMGTRVRLNLDLRKGNIKSSIPVEDIDGTVVMVGPIRDGRPLLSGHLDIRSARIVKKLVRNLRTNFTIQGPMLDFRDIDCDAYGGKVSGWFSVETATNDLEGDFTVSRLDLKDFINDTAKWSGKTISGKVELRIPGLSGKANDLASLKSERCFMSIAEGQLLDVPGIITFLNPLGVGERFTAMKANFDIHDQQFHIKELAFLGREGAGSVIGKGWFSFDGRFSLRVRTETASLFGIKFFLTDLPGALIDLVKSPFKFKVEGSLEDAKIFEE